MLRALFVDGTRDGLAGIRIGPGTRAVTIESCRIERAEGDGIRATARVRGLTVRNCAVIACGSDGIDLGFGVRAVLLSGNALLENGQRDGRRGYNGYGIVRRGGHARWARPQDVTLVQNHVQGNRGRARHGRSTVDFGRYDLMIDPTDDQAPFGR